MFHFVLLHRCAVQRFARMVIREHLCLLTLLASTASAFVPQLARRSIITTQTRRRAATNANADELLQQRADPTLAKDERRTIDALLVDHAWDRAGLLARARFK